MSLSERLIGLKQDLEKVDILSDQRKALDEAILMAKNAEKRYPAYHKARVIFIRDVYNYEVFSSYATDNKYVLAERGMEGIMMLSGPDNDVVTIKTNDTLGDYIYPQDSYIIDE